MSETKHIKTGDRVTYDDNHGVVVQYNPAQGVYVATCVVDWDLAEPSTVWASDLTPEER